MRKHPAIPILLFAMALAPVFVIVYGLVPRHSERSGPPPEPIQKLHWLWVAACQYRDDNGVFPDLRSPDTIKTALYPTYIKDPTAFVNVVAGGQPMFGNPSLSGKSLRSPGTGTNVPIFFYTYTVNSRYLAAAVDLSGTTRYYHSADWAKVVRANHLP